MHIIRAQVPPTYHQFRVLTMEVLSESPRTRILVSSLITPICPYTTTHRVAFPHDTLADHDGKASNREALNSGAKSPIPSIGLSDCAAHPSLCGSSGYKGPMGKPVNHSNILLICRALPIKPIFQNTFLQQSIPYMAGQSGLLKRAVCEVILALPPNWPSIRLCAVISSSILRCHRFDDDLK